MELQLARGDTHGFYEVTSIRFAFGECYFVNCPKFDPKPQIIHEETLDKADPDWRRFLQGEKR